MQQGYLEVTASVDCESGVAILSDIVPCVTYESYMIPWRVFISPLDIDIISTVWLAIQTKSNKLTNSKQKKGIVPVLSFVKCEDP
jgi:hypothetical protein